MAGEVVYADLNIGPVKRCRKRNWLPQPGTSGCPRWHRTALWASWTGNILLGVAVVAMGGLLLHRQPENPGSSQNGTGNVGDGNISLGNNILLELRKGLCSSKPPEDKGCKLCPTGWTLHGNKCYWVATLIDRMDTWNRSRADYVKRGAELLMPQDQDELDFINNVLENSTSFLWIGLSVPSNEKGWTWLNGSRLGFQFSPGDGAGGCGVLKWRRIGSEHCRLPLPWICQKAATQL